MTQGNDASPPLRLGHLVKNAEQVVISAKASALRSLDTTVPQYLALYLLNENSAASSAQLARQALVSPQSMNAVITTLEGKGLLTRRQSPDHSRVLLTELTEAGSHLLERADKAARHVEASIESLFDEDELATVRDGLSKIAAWTQEPD